MKQGALLLSFLLLLVGCAAAGPKPVVKAAPREQPVTVAPGQAVRPLSLTAFRLDVAPGQGVDYAEGGLACIPVQIRKTDQDISDPSAQQLLLGFVAAAFEARGYLIDRSGQAALSLTPSLVAYTASLCKPYTGIGDGSTGLGKIWIRMRWVVAERDSGTVLLDLMTEGDAGVDSSIATVARELMRRAIDRAASNLMADARFVQQLAGAAGAAAAPLPVATSQSAPNGPSPLDAKALASAQSAFDHWLEANQATLAKAIDSHLAALGQLPKGGVQALESASVRDLTAAGYVVALTYRTAAGSQTALFQVTLNEGRLQRLVLLT